LVENIHAQRNGLSQGSNFRSSM